MSPAAADTGLDLVVGDADLPRLHEARKEVSAEDYRRVRGIAWRNTHTDRFRRVLGDEDFCCGWDAEIGRWLMAQMRPRTIVEKFGVRTLRTVERVPVVWWVVEDDGTTPPSFLSIEDPRLPSLLLAAERHRNPGGLDRRIEAWKAEKQRRQQSWRREMHARTGELWEPFKRFADDLGVTGMGPALPKSGERRRVGAGGRREKG